MVQMKRKVVFKGKSSQLKVTLGAFRGNLERFRKENGLSQEALAHKAGLTGNYIWMLESGERSPSFAALAAISTALGLKDIQMLLEVHE